MGVAILNPQDSLLPLPKLDLARTNPTRVRQPRRRRSPTKSNASPPPPPAKTLVMGEVKLLRRGEELKGTALLKSPAADRLSESAPSRAESGRVKASARSPSRVVGAAQGPVARPNRAPEKPARVEAPTQKGVTESTESLAELASFYAGSAFVSSPPPSSLPVPAFCAKKNEPSSFVDATSDLRKLLRLE